MLCIMLLVNALQVYKRQAAGICYDNGSLPFVYTVVTLIEMYMGKSQMKLSRYFSISPAISLATNTPLAEAWDREWVTPLPSPIR